ncbi:MAG: hypothetical protein LUD81_01585 [Clostridiales bacterium]|nr:hypothetical protein [Clostridiales bacterium]
MAGPGKGNSNNSYDPMRKELNDKFESFKNELEGFRRDYENRIQFFRNGNEATNPEAIGNAYLRAVAEGRKLRTAELAKLEKQKESYQREIEKNKTLKKNAEKAASEAKAAKNEAAGLDEQTGEILHRNSIEDNITAMGAHDEAAKREKAYKNISERADKRIKSFNTQIKIIDEILGKYNSASVNFMKAMNKSLRDLGVENPTKTAAEEAKPEAQEEDLTEDEKTARLLDEYNQEIEQGKGPKFDFVGAMFNRDGTPVGTVSAEEMENKMNEPADQEALDAAVEEELQAIMNEAEIKKDELAAQQEAPAAGKEEPMGDKEENTAEQGKTEYKFSSHVALVSAFEAGVQDFFMKVGSSKEIDGRKFFTGPDTMEDDINTMKDKFGKMSEEMLAGYSGDERIKKEVGDYFNRVIDTHAKGAEEFSKSGPNNYGYAFAMYYEKAYDEQKKMGDTFVENLKGLQDKWEKEDTEAKKEEPAAEQEKPEYKFSSHVALISTFEAGVQDFFMKVGSNKEIDGRKFFTGPDTMEDDINTMKDKFGKMSEEMLAGYSGDERIKKEVGEYFNKLIDTHAKGVEDFSKEGSNKNEYAFMAYYDKAYEDQKKMGDDFVENLKGLQDKWEKEDAEAKKEQPAAEQEQPTAEQAKPEYKFSSHVALISSFEAGVQDFFMKVGSNKEIDGRKFFTGPDTMEDDINTMKDKFGKMSEEMLAGYSGDERIKKEVGEYFNKLIDTHAKGVEDFSKDGPNNYGYAFMAYYDKAYEGQKKMGDDFVENLKGLQDKWEKEDAEAKKEQPAAEQEKPAAGQEENELDDEPEMERNIERNAMNQNFVDYYVSELVGFMDEIGNNDGLEDDEKLFTDVENFASDLETMKDRLGERSEAILACIEGDEKEKEAYAALLDNLNNSYTDGLKGYMESKGVTFDFDDLSAGDVFDEDFAEFKNVMETRTAEMLSGFEAKMKAPEAKKEEPKSGLEKPNEQQEKSAPSDENEKDSGKAKESDSIEDKKSKIKEGLNNIKRILEDGLDKLGENYEENYDNVQKSVEKAENVLSDLKKDMDEIDDRFKKKQEQVKTENKKLNDEISDIKNENDPLKKERDKLENKKEKLENKKDKLEKDRDSLIKKNKPDKAKAKTDAIKDKESEIRNVNNEIEDKNKRIEKNERGIADRRNKINNNNMNITVEVKEMNIFRRACNKIVNAIGVVMDSIKGLLKGKTITRTSLDELQGRGNSNEARTRSIQQQPQIERTKSMQSISK